MTKGKGKHVTPERYKQLKMVIDNVKKGTKGINAIYDALGVSPSTASAIRVTNSYEEYRNKVNSYPSQIKKRQSNKKNTTLDFQTQHQTTDDLVQLIDEVLVELRATQRIVKELNDQYAEIQQEFTNAIVEMENEMHKNEQDKKFFNWG